ncbi:MAG: TonB-dependent receptor [Gemmatimonadaceae bacterium]
MIRVKPHFPYLALTLGLFAAPAYSQSAITGTVIGNDGRPVDAVTVTAVRADRSVAREAVTDVRGTFRLNELLPGVYSVTARKVGYRSAELPGVRVAAGQVLDVSVTLTQAPRQLSTITVVMSPTAVDASATELPVRLDREYTALLPSARTASSLIALVPGARKDQLWGGAPGVSNNYQLDGVSMNHPGLGGDFLTLSVDWIDRLDVRGLGAGAEHGNFQGGIINAITKTGTNERRYSLRTNFEAPALTASNFNLEEDGIEQAGRREIGGEAVGPIVRDRLFYFAAGQYVSRDMRSPNLATPVDDFQSYTERQSEARAMGKLTWLSGPGQRVDLLAGYADFDIQHAGINGIDDPTGTQRISRPASFYGLTWNNSNGTRNQYDLRVAGFDASESRSGYGGPSVPGVHVLQFGRQPRYQNAQFSERLAPRSLSANAEWRTRQRLWRESDHELLIGGEITRGWWRNTRLRNGGLTWRPYPDSAFDANDASTWGTVASEWGGEMRLNSDIASEAVFLQDKFSVLGSRLTITPGIRYSRWTGNVRPLCDPPGGRAGCHRFQAVQAVGFDPRIGVAWDVTGHNTFALKAHWGRYHQGMFALFFDRAEGANVYTNQRFYNFAPPITSARTTFTPEQRDAPGSGFDPFFTESILDASGRVDGYRQPYVDQSVLALEKSFGRSWKTEVTYTHRRNGDIVGLVDRNLATNYTPLTSVFVDHRFGRGQVLDPAGDRLVLPTAYITNQALKDLLAYLNARGQFPATVFGYDTAYVRASTWNPDVVLTAVPAARRHYDQVTVLLRTVQSNWRAEGSLTGARLKGNVPGVAGFGTTATRFSAGPFVNPNEGINGYGYLPDAFEMEGKLWLTARLPYSIQGGLLYTHVLGERFTPTFGLHGRYAYSDSAFFPVPPLTMTDEVFGSSYGQTILIEPRGSRRYGSRAIVDAHLEWRSPRRLVVTMDLFNALGANAIVGVKTAIDDQSPTDPTSKFGAPRLRVAPRTLRFGLRFE